jgi:hypothetical protein
MVWWMNSSVAEMYMGNDTTVTTHVSVLRVCSSPLVDLHGNKQDGKQAFSQDIKEKVVKTKKRLDQEPNRFVVT